MSKKGLTLDEKRSMILSLFKNKNVPAQEEVVVVQPEEVVDEEEELEKEYVKRKARHKKKQQGRIRPRGRR